MLGDSFGRPVTDSDIKKFAESVDKNADGKITKKELYEVFKVIAQMGKV
jgi:Ca2+-binding EF-hand superfamily protein